VIRVQRRGTVGMDGAAGAAGPLPPDAVVCCDVGDVTLWTSMTCCLDKPGRPGRPTLPSPNQFNHYFDQCAFLGHWQR